MIAATVYQVNPDRNHKLWNIVSTERYILHEYLSSPTVFIGVRDTLSLVLYVCLVDRYLSLCSSPVLFTGDTIFFFAEFLMLLIQLEETRY
jgi:hypothetical protein